LFVANCRFVGNESEGIPLRAGEVAVLEVRNSEFITKGSIVYSPARKSQVVLHHNLIVSDPFGVNLGLFIPEAQDVTVELEHNTIAAPISLQCYLDFMPEDVESETRQAVKPIRIQASENLFDATQAVLRFEQSSGFLQSNRRLSVAEMESVLRARVGWHGKHNGFPVLARFLDPTAEGRSLRPTRPSRTVADWNAFWELEDTQCVHGPFRYVRGNLLERARFAPESLEPGDYRLRPDSAGHQAGADGKDLGADVDIVGPGLAYERWKKTPQYQDWLKATGQLK
jgi:hypothetical protein